MYQYLRQMRDILDTGEDKDGRNGGYRSLFGGHAVYSDVGRKFPIVTTKKMAMRSMTAELLGFLNGDTSAAQFRQRGTRIWDINANDVEPWKSSEFRKGEDDLGRIYSSQWRDWTSVLLDEAGTILDVKKVDQIAELLDMLYDRDDKRRAILQSWNPGERDWQALPACHAFSQFSIRDGRYLDATMYQRSCDYPLGVPFNIASYALLMHLLGRVSGLTPRHFHHMVGDMHVYSNQILLAREQIERDPFPEPGLKINPKIKSFRDILNSDVSDYKLIGYKSHPPIDYPFSG